MNDKLEIIRQTIAQGHRLRMVYLKANSVRGERDIMPLEVSEHDCKGQSYLRLIGRCLRHNEIRNFQVDRILDLEPLDDG